MFFAEGAESEAAELGGARAAGSVLLVQGCCWNRELNREAGLLEGARAVSPVELGARAVEH
jgi:hypothetical protein